MPLPPWTTTFSTHSEVFLSVWTAQASCSIMISFLREAKALTTIFPWLSSSRPCRPRAT